MRQIVRALELEGEAFGNALRSVPDAFFARITNCPPWTLEELVVHTAGSIFVADFEDSDRGREPREAADYYRRPERDTKEYRDRTVEQTQRQAPQVLAHKSAATVFDETLTHTVAILRNTDLDRVIDIGNVGPMRIGDWLVSRVISVAAHGLDVALTTGQPSWTTTQALQVMRPVFVSLLEAEPPDALEWSDQAFFEIATGRRDLTVGERTTLDSRASRFPLLS